MVAWILEGSVRKSGDTVRIAVQLVHASDGFTATTAKTEAYSLYLEGRYLCNKRPGDVVWQALDRFERAISIDPDFAPAHAAVAGVYGTLGAWESGLLPPAEALSKAKAAAERALELDPKLAAGYTAIGYASLHFDWNADRACKELDEAIALNPAWVDAHHWHSSALCAAAKFPESLAACRRIVELDPLNPLMHAHDSTDCGPTSALSSSNRHQYRSRGGREQRIRGTRIGVSDVLLPVSHASPPLSCHRCLLCSFTVRESWRALAELVDPLRGVRLR